MQPLNSYNFSSGPAMLPHEVMLEIQRDLLNWQGLQRSVMEISHRSKPFDDMIKQAEHDFRELLDLPANYQVLFVHGSASHQFAMIPMNIYGKGIVDYIDTGTWSHKAVQEAEKFTKVNKINGLKKDEAGRTQLIDSKEWVLSSDADYLFYTPNETIGGVQFADVPDSRSLYGKDVPLIADMSSCILSRPVDVSRFGLIFAGAQKNIGTAGLTMVIIRDDLIRRVDESVPTLMQYKTYADYGSLYNTPPVFPVYVAGLVFAWVKKQGSLQAMAEINQRKAEKLYQCIDTLDFYSSPIAPDSRSVMNVPFLLAEDSFNKQFLQQAESKGLYALNGHRSVGGMRASIYNAMPEAGIDALTSFLGEFATTATA
ncbi:MAG TPA: 3-phosphoserine/phosphohydroxythreonine transaminase [Aeromonadales bacterium]|nr:3-phosphoserine/phosphohydroxythreonine transaminase [Aeromonadales bacterium]